MANKERIFINIDEKVPLVMDTPPTKPESTDMKKSIRLYIKVK